MVSQRSEDCIPELSSPCGEWAEWMSQAQLRGEEPLLAHAELGGQPAVTSSLQALPTESHSKHKDTNNLSLKEGMRHHATTNQKTRKKKS